MNADRIRVFRMNRRFGLREPAHGAWAIVLWAIAIWLLALANRSSATEEFALAVYPSEIQLHSAEDRHRWVVVETTRDGVTRDVTDEVELRFSDPTIARSESALVIPLAAGQTQLRVGYLGQSVEVPIQVDSVAPAPPVNFRSHVEPILRKAGCNSGACHGASRGQDGFALSLFGFDPENDYFRITREMGDRRVNLGFPERSLLLQKATGSVLHTGGKRIDVGSREYDRLKRWIEQGAAAAPPDTPTVRQITLSPPSVVLRGDLASQRLLVTAEWSDGSRRDVTDLAVFGTTDAGIAEVDANATLRGNARGEAFIICQFDVHTVGCQTLVLPNEDRYTPPESDGNYIDEIIDKKLRTIRYLPSPLCSDSEYLRRVTIDLNGRLPTVQELEAFLNDPSADKRDEVAQRLVNRSEFDDLWVAYWADIFLVNTSQRIEKKPAYRYYDWLRDTWKGGAPIDEVIRAILVANGTTFDDPQTNFYASEPDRLKIAENVAQSCLGIRTQCARCHNHPFDRWTMDDYYGFAAFFGQIARKREEDYREWVIFRNGAQIKHPVTQVDVQPKFLGGGKPEIPAGKDRLPFVADWITADDNPYFAKNVANRVWAHFFGQGIVEPVDDVRISNPPSIPALYVALAKRLCETKFDVRQLSLDIVTSHAYQRSVQHPRDAPIHRNFGRAKNRRLSARVLLDCISQVTESFDDFPGVEEGGRAIQLPIEPQSNYFLKSFGQSARTSVCACEASDQPTLSQALHLLNGVTTNEKIKNGKWLPRQLSDGRAIEDIVTDIYRRCLSRPPTQNELTELVALIAESDQPREGLQDAFWAVLNSREFVFNH